MTLISTWADKGFQLMYGAFYDPSAANNDFFRAEHHNNILQAMKGNKVITGFEVTEQAVPSLTVDIASGETYINGTKYTFSADTCVLTALVPGTPGESNYVMIYIDSTGTLNKLAGDDAITGAQKPPEILEGTTPIALVLLTNGDAQVNTNQIGDLRIYTVKNERIEGELVVGDQITSLVTSGTSPLIIASNTLVTNLNADLLDGQEGSYYSPTTHDHDLAYQPLDANLTTIAALIPVTDSFMIGGVSDWEQKTPSQIKSILDLEIGTDIQAYDADLAVISGFAHVDGNIMVSDGLAWVLESGATARTSLGLSIGSDVQAYNAHLTTIAGLSKTDGNFVVTNGTGYVVESGATARNSIGLGVANLPEFAGLKLTGDIDANSLANISMTELSYLDGVSSNLQTQLDAKEDTLTFGIVDGNAVKIDSGVTINDNEYVRFTTSGIEGRSTALVKSDLGLGDFNSPQFAGLKLTGDLDANSLANITMTEMSYLSGVTSNIQTQISNNDGDITSLDGRVTQNETDISSLDTSVYDSWLAWGSLNIQQIVLSESGYISGSFTRSNTNYDFSSSGQIGWNVPLPILKEGKTLYLKRIRWGQQTVGGNTNYFIFRIDFDTANDDSYFYNTSVVSTNGDVTVDLNILMDTSYKAVFIKGDYYDGTSLKVTRPILEYYYV